MGSLSTLTINFECLEHKLRWGGPRAPVALCSVACWDIFADWAQLKHPWSVFTRLELLKAYLRWKKKKMRGNTQVGKKSWLPHWGGGFKETSAPAWCVCCHLIPELTLSPSLGLPVPPYHSQETEGCLFTRPPAAHSLVFHFLCGSIWLFVSSQTSLLSTHDVVDHK